MRSGVITRVLHRLHRWTGTFMAALMAMWFASGAVMTFAVYPEYTDAERLAHGAPLVAASASVPPELVRWLEHDGLAAGGRARLSMQEGEPRWTLQGDTYLALRAQPPWEVPALDAGRARDEAERAYGACRGDSERIAEADQWTVGRTHPQSYPLLRFACEDASGQELYVSSRSGEIVQQSTRMERMLAWLGPIPHWIYPAALRRERALWRTSVLWLSGLGLVVTLSGMLAGMHAAMRGRREVQRQVYLRWHQRLGLGFGVLASCWVFSGALSLEPFHWSSADTDPARALYHARVGKDLATQLAGALDHCRSELQDVRELELVALGRLYALCSDAAGYTRVVDLADPSLTPLRRIDNQRLSALAQDQNGALTLAHAPDDYYYPTHRRSIALPYARITLPDAAQTALYIDPARGQLVAQLDARTRLERWLYHGLHSWDFPALYGQRTLWRTLLIAAMSVGTALAVLGALMILRRQRLRKGTSRPRPRSRSRSR
jgi:hypothetical protein